MASMLSTREFKANKAANFSEWYNQIIYATDLVDTRYNVQGFVVHKPWATYLLRYLYRLFERELEADGHQPVQFPVVIPEENFLKEADHVAGFSPEVFWITHMGDEKLARKMALRPTSETAFYQMYALWVQSFADLPIKYYQSCTVYRGEKETNPFLRGREFNWIETHDVFATHECAVDQVKKDTAIYRRVATDMLGLPLMIFKRPSWDKFAGADDTYAYDTLMPDGKAFQIGSTHDLGQHFTKAFEVQFTDAQGKREHPFTTCFGPGIWRVIGALIGVHGDDKGLILPFDVAPTQIVIVPIVKSASPDAQAVLKHANVVQARLTAAGFRVALDSSDKTPGYKYNYWELRGVPLRVEIGGQEAANSSATVVRRDTREKKNTPLDGLDRVCMAMAFDQLADLKEKAQRHLAAHVTDATNRDEVKKALDSTKGFVRVPYCGVSSSHAACAEELKTFTNGGKVRGTLAFTHEEVPKGAVCASCGKPASVIAYVAKQY